jgi:hypothetical protein
MRMTCGTSWRRQIAAGSDAEPMHLARILADHSMHVELT